MNIMPKQLQKIIAITAAITGATLMSSCTAPNAMLTKTSEVDGKVTVKTIVNNPILNTRIGVTRTSMTMVGDLKRTSLSIQNGWFYSNKFEYKILWFDASGTEINPEGASWKPLLLEGRETKTVQSTAPNASAVDVLIYLRKQ